MFSYFKREESDKNDGIGYRKRVEQKWNEIISSTFKTEASFEDALNLETLAIMSVPKEEWNIPSVYSISKFANEYEEYIKERFFHGMEIDEFENNNELMLEFYMIKENLRKEYIYNLYEELDEMYSEYSNLPKREKMIKPVYNPGMYATFYASPDNMWEYLYCKNLSKKYADSILNNGIKDFAEEIAYTLDCYAKTEDEKSIRHAIQGVSKELRRKNNKLSNKEISNIEKTLKSI